MKQQPRRRVLLAAAAVATLGLVAAGCGDDDDETSASGAASGGDESREIAVISPYLSQQPATKEVVDKFTAQAEQRGWEVTTIDTANDFARFNTEMRNAASQGVDAIVLGMGDPQQMGPGLSAASDAGIPVFGLDAGVAEGVTANITSDNQFLGQTSAQAMIDAIGGEGSVLMFTYDDFEPVRVRGQEARAYFEENGIEVLDYIRIDAPNGLADAKAKAKDLLARYGAGEVDGIWSAWDQAANGAYQAVEEAGRTDVKVTGVDGQDFAIAAINEGGAWVATVRQDWDGIAAKAAETIEAHFGGTHSAEQQVLVPGQLITAQS